MEGGGARGNTYLGAIEALEEQLAAREKKDEIDVADIIPGRPPAIMDYLEKDSDGVPLIRGVSGASAGAITTFALALGLNSKEITGILKFDFDNFLNEKDVAKYRMIADDNGLAIGEDKKKTIGKKNDRFEYTLKQDKTKITGNYVKKKLRPLIINIIIKIIADGLASNLQQLGGGVTAVLSIGGSDTKAVNNWKSFLGAFKGSGSAIGAFIRRTVYNKLINYLLFRIINLKNLPKIDANTVASVFLDRGMSSGFQVREFFYDMLLLAATRDTYFQKRLIAYFDDKKVAVGKNVRSLTIKRADLTHPSFTIGERSKLKLNVRAKSLFEHLQNITFREFHEIMRIDFAAAVTNYSTNSLCYFSDSWTPHFRILEAVGASMTIPPGIRTIFNASNVYLPHFTQPIAEASFPISAPPSRIYVTVNGTPKTFVDEQGDFSRSDYILYEFVVKKILQAELLNERDDDQGTYISLNNLIGLESFLPVLKSIVIGKRLSRDPEDLTKDSFQKRMLKNWEVKVNGNTYKVNMRLLTFFYNAQFKGLLIDGGYLNNIPYNYFRAENELIELDEILALKLENSFPPDLIVRMHDKFKAALPNAKSLKRNLAMALSTDPHKLTNVAKDTVKLPGLNTSNLEMKRMVVIAENEFRLYMTQQEEILKSTYGNLNQKQLLAAKNIDRKSILKIIDQWVDEYLANDGKKPWEIEHGIYLANVAAKGFSYGAERGQIRSISDHDHIVQLYDYGVGVFDFNLSKVRPMAVFSQIQAKAALHSYFTKPKRAAS